MLVTSIQIHCSFFHQLNICLQVISDIAFELHVSFLCFRVWESHLLFQIIHELEKLFSVLLLLDSVDSINWSHIKSTTISLQQLIWPQFDSLGEGPVDLHHLFPPLHTCRLEVGFGTLGLAQSQCFSSSFEELFWCPVQAERAGTWGRMVHDAGGWVEGCCGWW